MLGRVSAVISPVQQLASIASMALAGLLASTVLRGFHEVIGGVTFGPYDTVLTVGGLLFLIAGLASIAPMRGASRQSAGREDASPDSPTPEASPIAEPAD
jgi:hypothetical protein